MPGKRRPVKAKRVRARPATKRARPTPSGRRRPQKATAAQLRQRRELEGVRADVTRLRSDLRRVRRELRQARIELERLRGIEREAEGLRRELGPQRPLLPLPNPVPGTARDPWMPPIVETHLTVLHDHDVAALDGILTPDIVVTEVPFPLASRQGPDDARAWHAELFAAWTDFRFMPRHWHNVGGAAFLEGEASFIQRGERHGIRAQAKLVTLDMLLIYHLSEAGIGRIKLYYDGATLRRQLATPGVQGELF